MTDKSFEELMKGFVGNSLTKEELAHFMELVRQNKYQHPLQQGIDDLLEKESLSAPVNEDRGNIIFQKIMDAANREGESLPANRGDESLPAKTLPLAQRIRFFKPFRVAAAVILIILSAGIYVYLGNRTGKASAVTGIKKTPALTKDMAPGTSKAILVLADGTSIDLDDTNNGEVARQGNSKVIKINGKLAYNSSSLNNSQALYNTIATPRGGQYQVELADGTLVWLNAASSIHFPTTFGGNERKVEITGEAYFEVSKNKDKPFIVVANAAEIRVLGTHFNVMAYHDENELTTTLLEGSVKFISGDASRMLVPGQQSQLSKNGRLSVLNNVDVNAVVAWKNGLFHFEKAAIETVMKELSRWYDVELVYQDVPGPGYPDKKIGDLLHADIPRSTKLTDVLKALEIAGGGKFEVQGKKIIIRK